MRISRVRVENFRNFELLDVPLSRSVVILGENKVGKSNLVYALRLVLDPSLPDSARQLRREDRWDGIDELSANANRILIAVDIADFEGDVRHVAMLSDHLIQATPMVARVTYIWQPLPILAAPPAKDADYEFFIYGGDKPDNRIGSEIRRRLPMDVLPALRDAEGDLARWGRSPLRPLLDTAASQLKASDLDSIAADIETATSAVAVLSPVVYVAGAINDKLQEMVGKVQSLDAALRYAPTDASKLIRALRIFIDGGRRPVADASLGSANVLYLALKLLEYEQLADEHARDHTFLAIEEPEAHLHPILQRLVFRNYLRPRGASAPPTTNAPPSNVVESTTVFVTTHSPHIASVAPLRSFLVLRHTDAHGTVGRSLAESHLQASEVEDLERYINVSRGELLFARAVILVEGDAEELLLPVLARQLGVDLDEYGVAVCSIGGTHFAPFVSLVGTDGLALRFSLITDLDPTDTGNLGEVRVTNGIMPRILDSKSCESLGAACVLAEAPKHGIFLNGSTFEIELWQSGYGPAMAEALVELLPQSSKAKEVRDGIPKGEPVDHDIVMSLIERVGKGRFAQRLANHLPQSQGKCPTYIAKAIEWALH